MENFPLFLFFSSEISIVHSDFQRLRFAQTIRSNYALKKYIHIYMYAGRWKLKRNEGIF